jgi:hypothetical protein
MWGAARVRFPHIRHAALGPGAALAGAGGTRAGAGWGGWSGSGHGTRSSPRVPPKTSVLHARRLDSSTPAPDRRPDGPSIHPAHPSRPSLHPSIPPILGHPWPCPSHPPRRHPVTSNSSPHTAPTLTSRPSPTTLLNPPQKARRGDRLGWRTALTPAETGIRAKERRRGVFPGTHRRPTRRRTILTPANTTFAIIYHLSPNKIVC